MNQTQEMSRVSIIMPVYNSEKYIKNAVLSVLNQTYKNLELIAVDDGSTDNSLEILNNIKKEDSRLKVYTKENGGISSARNYGIDRATGEYIGFIDNDDEYVPELIADNIKLIVKYNAEIIKFNKIKRIVEKESNNHTVKIDFPVTYLENTQIIAQFDKINLFGGTIWNALYKKDFLNDNNIRFDESDRNVIEDHRFNLDCYKKLNSIVLNSKTYYIWNMRIGHSTSGRFIEERFEQMKIEANNLYLFLEEKNIDKYLPNYWSYIKTSYLINIILVTNYKNSGFNKRKFCKYLKELKRYDLFGRNCTNIDLQFIRKQQSFFRSIVIKLYDRNQYYILFLLAKLKFQYEIKFKNRRF